MEELKNSCRCCLRPIECRAIQISKNILQRFELLTRMKLIMSEDFSSRICESCNSRIIEFADFQNELIENQIQLYTFIAPKELEDHDWEIQPSSENCNDTTSEFIGDIKYQQFEEYTENEAMQHADEFINTRETLEISIQNRNNSFEISKTGRSSMKNCQYCGTEIHSENFNRHLLEVHPDRFRFVCDNCEKGFRFKRDLVEHMKCHMNMESRQKFSCTQCESRFLSKCSLKNHIQSFHSDVIEKHPCDLCSKIFSSRMKLNQHILVVHNKGSFKCEICSRTFRVKYNLQKHVKKEHGEKEKCNLCGKFVAKGRHMREHMLHHEPPKFACNFENCVKKFQSKKAQQYHIETQHQELKKSFECDLCSTSSFNSLRNLNRHISRQHNKIRIACEIEGCGHMSSRKDYLASHYKNHKDIHQKTKEKFLEKVKNMKELPW